MKEIWKDIKGYEGIYIVSNLGRVKRLKGIRINKNGVKITFKEKYMTATLDSKGYMQVHLRKNNKQRHILLHRLVAMAFLDNPDNLPEVNHKDENKGNNCVENLEWCDKKYNANYGTSKERISKKLSKKVFKYDLDGKFICEYNSTQSTKKDGFEPKHVSDCALGKRKTHKGFKWKYVKER